MGYIQLKRKLSCGGLLCAILDNEFCAHIHQDIFSLAARLTRCGVDIIQYRFKSIPDRTALEAAGRLVKIAGRYGKTCIVNDRADIAWLSGAQGVHLGQTDISSWMARRLLGKKKIIGRTVHSQKEFNEAQKEPVDYVSLGPVYPPGIKAHLPAWGLTSIARLVRKSRKPVFVIGGITPHNVYSIVEKKITHIAVAKALLQAKDLKKTVASFKEQICSRKPFYNR
ncbi:MAG: thiamine phosphate synthase [Candidatus Omnitrophica bacterium]|nr:thiamine phosphate synthase [Candidatus Omnitrophota bacterium]